MMYARDPRTGLSVRPNPGARAECPYCNDNVHAKCGEVLEWHWAHSGETCELARDDAASSCGDRTPGSISAPKGTCPSCEYWEQGCTAGTRMAALWLEEHGDTQSSLARVRRFAPQCPSHLQARYYSAERRNAPCVLHPSQIID